MALVIVKVLVVAKVTPALLNNTPHTELPTEGVLVLTAPLIPESDDATGLEYETEMMPEPVLKPTEPMV